ncbi:TIGR04206 family protein [Halorubrum sp. JWXQ-INN 858]|uniref:TIGR04206 family protein n=1 Tax=Halorubrum sp. JWXQ-INN 858 TaxID=2690782 RepID=UPI00135A5DEB|nr:TIGR04206 family protein [Halorubrum sp. JWXQ-INN 858]MWV65152.1 TIGR04206 family protein [Halorubrum sp. JWXQ-INN 858]
MPRSARGVGADCRVPDECVSTSVRNLRNDAASDRDAGGGGDPAGNEDAVGDVTAGRNDATDAFPRDDVSGGRSVLAVLLLLVVPVAVVPSGSGDLTLVSLWGFVNTGPSASGLGIHLYPVWSYFGDHVRPFSTLPASIQVWPLALGFHLLAVASAASGAALGREDRRVTGGLLVLAALATSWVTVGLAGRFGVGQAAGTGWFSVLPVGAVVTLALTAVLYGDALRRLFRLRREEV